MKQRQATSCFRYLLCALVLVGACDCEDQLRKAVSNSGDRKMSPSTTGGSGPAEVEPNDAPGQASPIRLGKELRDVQGEISAAGDVDWYSITGTEDGLAFEVVVSPESGLDLSIHVEVEGGAALAYDDGRGGSSERIGALRVGTTPQRIVVRSQANSTGSYRFSFKRQLAADTMEAEPNDDTTVATNLSMPGEVQGFYDRVDDRDVYRLTGDANKPYALEIGSVAGVRQIARIFDDAALTTPQLTLQVADAPVLIPNIGIDATKPRWLVLTALGTPRVDQPYRLSVAPHPEFDGPLEIEPNDVVPTDLPFGQPDEDGARGAAISGYLHAADDHDRFRLLPPSGIPTTTPIPREVEGPDYIASYRTKTPPRVPVKATLTWTDRASAFGLRWTSGDGTVVEFRQLSPVLEVEACGLDLDDGEATVEVRAERLAAAPKVGMPQYHLSVVESSAAEGFEGEPNDQRGQADILEAARRGTFALPDDVDNFAFAVPGEEEVRKVRVSARARGVDVVMRILDDGGGLVANVDNAAVGSAESIDLDLPSGLYFVELRWKGGGLCSPYSLKLTLLP